MNAIHRRAALIGLGALVVPAAASRAQEPVTAGGIGTPPQGFTSAMARVHDTNLHYVKGGQGPALILVHGFPEDWTEYRAILTRLGKRFTVVAVDLPGIGKSAPANGGYDAANLAAHLQALAEALKLERPYVVGHDLGGIVTYAWVRRFADSLSGAMILDVPVPGMAGWDEAVAGFWHIGFIQAPGHLAERLVSGKQDVFLGFTMDIAKFTPQQRAYYFRIYSDPQLHAAFEVYRAFPRDAEFNAAQTAPNAVPLVVAAGEASFFAKLVPKFVDGYRAKGMRQVESATIPNASHYVLADNPDAVAELIEKHAGR